MLMIHCSMASLSALQIHTRCSVRRSPVPKTKDSAERLGPVVENSHRARNVSQISHRSGCTICVSTTKCLSGCLDMLTSPGGLARTTRPAICASRSFCAVSRSCCDTFAGAVCVGPTDQATAGFISLGRDITAQCSAPDVITDSRGVHICRGKLSVLRSRMLLINAQLEHLQ